MRPRWSQVTLTSYLFAGRGAVRGTAGGRASLSCRRSRQGARQSLVSVSAHARGERAALPPEPILAFLRGALRTLAASLELSD